MTNKTTITWQQFHENFLSLKQQCPSYRLGQHFCNLFIKDSDPTTCDAVVKGLWDKTGDEAFVQCFKVIKYYQWDLQDLPLIDSKLVYS